VNLTDYSKHDLVRELTTTECGAALTAVERFQTRALETRSYRWAYGSDDLYLGADVSLPPADAYDGFEQVENGVGSVRYLQQQIEGASGWRELRHSHVGIVTGTAMGRLMPSVTESLRAVTGATYEVITVQNDLFGSSVTSAGLLPGGAVRRALEGRADLDLALVPAESVNDHGVFLDDLAWDASVPLHLSYDFHDALGRRDAS
jgi:NifB/MoaA-like Fe-S oxidoreductase